jgi:hypothetical protein
MIVGPGIGYGGEGLRDSVRSLVLWRRTGEAGEGVRGEGDRLGYTTTPGPAWDCWGMLIIVGRGIGYGGIGYRGEGVRDIVGVLVL